MAILVAVPPFARAVKKLEIYGSEHVLELASSDKTVSTLISSASFPGDTIACTIECKKQPDVHLSNPRDASLTALVPERIDGTDLWRVSFVRPRSDICCIASSDEALAFVLSDKDQKNPVSPKLEKGPYKFRTAVSWALPALLFLLLLTVTLRLGDLGTFGNGLALAAAPFATIAGFFGIRLTQQLVLPYRLFLRSVERARFTIMVAIAGILFSCIWLVEPVQCIWGRAEFQKELRRALESDVAQERIKHARDAIVRFPERPEPYLIMAKAFDDLRGADRGIFSRESAALIGDPELEAAVLRFVNGTGECNCTSFSEITSLRERQRVLGWWMLKEAEGKVEKEEGDGLFLVTKNLTPEARAFPEYKYRFLAEKFEQFEGYYHFQWLASSWGGISNSNLTELEEDERVSFLAAHRIAEELHQAVFGESGTDNQASQNAEVSVSHLYGVQIALDRLIQHHIKVCDFELAANLVAELMLRRSRFRDPAVLWLDGPEKLSLFQTVRYLRASDPLLNSNLLDRTRDLKGLFDFCVNGKVATQKLKVQFQADFPDWLKPDESSWRLGTAEGQVWSDLENRISVSQNSNWRY